MMKRWLADTLFKRLFVLMWVALVTSHLAGFMAVHQLPPPGGEATRRYANPLPPLPSLPPGLLSGPGPRRDTGAGPGAQRRHSPTPVGGVFLDYLIRFVMIGGAAWWGARWLSTPVRRLAGAAQALAENPRQRLVAAPLDEGRGTLEIRQASQVFNTMVRQLQAQFSAQDLLMASISHDLRTPLSRMRMRLEQLEPGPLAERFVADIQEMDHLIGGVLELMRHGHSAGQAQRLDMAALVQALVDDLAEQGKPVSLSASARVDTPLVRADAAALARVLHNLVSNALRYGGAAELSISTADGEVAVQVSDPGPGIPDHQLEAVFVPFHRLTPGTPGGSGLGLYIARDLSERQNGRLTLANRTGGGFTATLVMPLCP